MCTSGFSAQAFFANDEETTALGVSLAPALGVGDVLLLSGPNGVGKSTLLRTLYRSYLPAGGRILYRSASGWVDIARAADVDIAELRRRDIGFVTQFLTARPRISAEEFVAEPLIEAGQLFEEALSGARALLTAFGVHPDLWPAFPSTFSGGEQQKVNLARGLACPANLLLLDEPMASLDIEARSALGARLASLKSKGTAMIGVFHHPGDIEPLIDREMRLGAVGNEVMLENV